jgi:RNA polymerase sigma-70 factor (ECF subfamily)
LKSEDEHKLIKKAQNDMAFFEPIYELYYLPIFYFVARRTNNRDVAGEVTSIVFLKALENIKKYNFQGLPFSAWLYRIAQNTSVDMYRKNKAQHVIDTSTERL